MFARVLLATCVVVSGGAYAAAPARAADLSGKIIAIDPGHQRGNSNPQFSREVNRKKFNGSIRKVCNTSGTATNKGFPESTFNWRVAQQLRTNLEAQGARVVLTRDSDSYEEWGPCAWDRPLVANAAGADVFISIHADGAPARASGFHVIAPSRVKGYTDDISKESRVLARKMIAGMKDAGAKPATYIAGALSVRGDQSTLNFSDVPAVVVELGNMRNRKEARAMSSRAGQKFYADALAAGINRYFADQ
ncbi:MAG: hypothetical protein RJB01_297 [Actinomycetota bacterium]|jgi:N-acetylmuramoyl-L-alanine amidase